MTMHMVLNFSKSAMFFIAPLDTKGDTVYFIISLVSVIVYSTIFSYMLNEYLKKRIQAGFEPIFDFINMFIIMTYNFWIILAYFVGRVIGYAIWSTRSKRILEKSFFKNLDVC